MATTLVKGLVAVGALGTASGVGTLVYLNTGTTISDKLTSDGIKLISDQDDYKFHLFTYKTDTKLQSAIGETTIDHTKHVSKLKEWCDKNLKQWASSDKDNSIFDNAKVWCVVPTIRTLGDKVKGNFHEEGEWQNKYQSFAKPASKNEFLEALKVQFPSFTFAETTEKAGEKMKEWCETTKRTKIYEEDKYRTAKNLETWCIKS